MDEVKIRAEIQKKQEKWLDDAALSPLTGQILAAVWVDHRGEATIFDADQIGEFDLICHLVERIRGANMGAAYKVAGFNIREFDLPWLCRRAWAVKAKSPPNMIRAGSRWFDLPKWMFDLRDIWSFGQKFEKGSLGAIAEFLGVGNKVGTGDDFYRNWRDPVMHAEAEAYLLNDGLLMPKILEHLIECSFDEFGLNLQHTNQ